MGEFPTKEEFFSALAGKHGSELQKRISSSSVAICGLGGLGSNIAAILVRSGIGMLRLIDFDRVDLSNIGRQQYFMTQTGMYKTDALAENLRTISTYTEIHTYTERISEENASRLIGNCEIVCEAFDRAEEKAMLVNHVLEKMPGTYIVAASGMAGISSANTVTTRKVSSRLYICGDGVSDISEYGIVFPSRVMICAAHQAHTVLRIIAGQYDA